VVEHQICDREVLGTSFTHCAVEYGTSRSRTPSSIIWYYRRGSDAPKLGRWP